MVHLFAEVTTEGYRHWPVQQQQQADLLRYHKTISSDACHPCAFSLLPATSFSKIFGRISVSSPICNRGGGVLDVDSSAITKLTIYMPCVVEGLAGGLNEHQCVESAEAYRVVVRISTEFRDNPPPPVYIAQDSDTLFFPKSYELYAIDSYQITKCRADLWILGRDSRSAHLDRRYLLTIFMQHLPPPAPPPNAHFVELFLPTPPRPCVYITTSTNLCPSRRDVEPAVEGVGTTCLFVS